MDTMTPVNIALGIVLIVASLFLIVAVLMQHGKAHNLSGTIAGGAETFFGKTKGQTIDKKLSIITTVIAIIFVALVLAVYLMQDTDDTSGQNSTYVEGNIAVTTAVTTDEAEEPATETEAPASGSEIETTTV